MEILALNEHGETITRWELDERDGKSITASFLRTGMDRDLLARAGKKLILRFSVPIKDIHGYWTPAMFRPQMHLDWNISLASGQQRNFPYLAFFRMDQQNAVSAALTCASDDVLMRVSMDQMRCTYRFEITVAVVPETAPFELLVSFAPVKWNSLLEAYRAIVLPQGKPHFSDDAFQPVYCTWYAVHAAITQEYLDRNAERAAAIGCRTFIVDDGWSYPEMKRVCPEAFADGWYRDIGNWTVSEDKLPGFKKNVEYAQSLGLKYLLWTAPFFVGPRSAEYKMIQDFDREVADDSDTLSHAVLEPDSPVAFHARDLLVDLVRTLGLDGLKIDFLDWVPLSVEKPRSRQCKAYFEALSAGLREQKADALIEFRQHYATPQMLAYATQFRAGDVPFDFMENLHRIAQIRVCLGDAVPCHADPVYFHPDESAENVARHMIAALAGVPMFSMDFRNLSSEHEKIVRFWLDFYRHHFELFRSGHWEVDYFMDTLSSVTVENETDAVAILAEDAAFPRLCAAFGNKTLFVLNFTPNTLDVFDCPAANTFTCSGDALPPCHSVPTGGLARIPSVRR